MASISSGIERDKSGIAEKDSFAKALPQSSRAL
jgi:hypothetical protein